MTDISRFISDHFLHPRNVDDFADAADASGEACSFTCGALVRLSLQIDAKSQKITGANFKAAGCSYLIAAASVTTEILTNMPLDEAHNFNAETLAAHLYDLPKEKTHCAALCSEALANALAHFSFAAAAPHEEWIGEEALICVCFGVAEKTIERVVQEQNLQSVEAVTATCNAGGGCGSCHFLIEDMIEDYRRTRSAQMQ